MSKPSTTTRGFSLVELMVALLIGSFLIIGAVTVFVQSRNTYSVSETVARLQENARYAMSTLEPDIRLANYWGLMNDPELITGTAGNAPLGSGATTNDCGAQFDIDLQNPLQGLNNSYTLACTANTGASPDPAFTRTPDTVIVRHAAEAVSLPDGARLQVYSTRQGAGSQVFNNSTAPGAPGATNDVPPLGPQAEVRDLVVRAYYVSAGSSQNRTPSLRRKNLAGGAGGPAFIDEEILPGVEDMQVQFGIDTGVDANGDGAFDDADANGVPDHFNGIAVRYVNPGDAALATAQVVSVRLWLLLRADTPEVGFTNSTRFTYGDVVDYLPNDSFRRLLVSRTIQIRNTVNLQI